MKASSAAINTVAKCMGRFEDVEPLIFKLMAQSRTIGLGMFDYDGGYRRYKLSEAPVFVAGKVLGSNENKPNSRSGSMPLRRLPQQRHLFRQGSGLQGLRALQLRGDSGQSKPQSDSAAVRQSIPG